MASKLSIYSAPPHQSKYIDEQPGRLQSGCSVVRKTVWPYVTCCKNACSSIKHGVQDTIQFGKDSYVYLKNPPPEFLPRVGVVTVSGLAGLVLARKGSRLKKIAYPLGLTTLGISVCYPAQAVIFAKLTGMKMYSASHRTYEAVRSLWKPSTQKEEIQRTETSDPKLPVSVTEGNCNDALAQSRTPKYNTSATEALSVTPSAEGLPISPPSEPQHLFDEEALQDKKREALTSSDPTKETKFNSDPNLLDHGQSNPEDVDMYSTRS
ncbi:MICOS complex subunit MIC27 isoform X2 [Ascaphus truei]|uniref:MICOS complex subunit MIC27 isoform X2 n=1 Tax=Ascaphus truei TaxID=8439 RepID=UPI003F594ECF